MSVKPEGLIPYEGRLLRQRVGEALATRRVESRLKKVEKGIKDNDGILHVFARASGDMTNIWVSFRVNHRLYDSNETPYAQARGMEISLPLDRFAPCRPYWSMAEFIPDVAELVERNRVDFVNRKKALEFLNREFLEIEPVNFSCWLADIVGCAEVKRYWWIGSLGEDKDLSVLQDIAQRVYLRKGEQIPADSHLIVESLLKDPKSFGRYVWIARSKVKHD